MKDVVHGIHPTRIRPLNSNKPVQGDFVLYWMQQSMRGEENQALEYAVGLSNSMRLPVVVCFGLTDHYPDANLRHYQFLMEGLREVKRGLERRSIPFVIRRGSPPEVALEIGKNAAVIVADRGYLRHQRQWRDQVAQEAKCPSIEVESDVVVPVQVASDKQEYSARTFRPKVMNRAEEYLGIVPRVRPKHQSFGGLESVLRKTGKLEIGDEVDRSVEPSEVYAGGTHEAKTRLRDFIQNQLPGYAENRNQPQTEYVSHMGMYLHFGHISPISVANAVIHSNAGSQEDRDSYLDELIVRRELAMNFVYYSGRYDSYSGIPEWAAKSLARHKADHRPHRYTRSQLERAGTHDSYWNAAMMEMKATGYMHNYMRMYWGKKILEWSATPASAYKTALYLNNKYFLDGRDPASYANIGWIFGLHDRPWKEREIYGTVRTMTARGLERKSHPDKYVEKIEGITNIRG